MPNITDVERIQRLKKIEDLIEQDYSDHAISQELGLAIEVIKRNKTYLEELKKAELTGKEIANKRAELYLEFDNAAREAKDLFSKCKNAIDCPLCNAKGYIEIKKEEGSVKAICQLCKGRGEIDDRNNAAKFHKQWIEAIEKMAQLYGLNSIKTDIQINQQFNDNRADNQFEPVDRETAKNIRNSIIERHEKKVKNGQDRKS